MLKVTRDSCIHDRGSNCVQSARTPKSLGAGNCVSQKSSLIAGHQPEKVSSQCQRMRTLRTQRGAYPPDSVDSGFPTKCSTSFCGGAAALTGTPYRTRSASPSAARMNTYLVTFLNPCM